MMSCYQTKDKKESEKTTKNLIKISVKIGMLQRGERFSTEEIAELRQIQLTLRIVVKTLITFYQVEHTYDRYYCV